MDFLENLRNKYKDTPTLREFIKQIPIAGGPIDALVAPDDALRFFTPIDKSFLKKQSRKKVESILNISIGDWPLIVQKLDVKRDLQEKITPSLIKCVDHPSLLVILGNPGAGKTTLLRRIGKILADSGRAVFELRASARSTPEWLNYLSDLPKKDGLPFILIDDIFRYEGMEDVLLDADLRCIIVANSRANEDKTNRLRRTNTLDFLRIENVDLSKSGWPILKEPSDRELSELRNRSEFSHIDSKKWQSVTTMRVGNETVASPMLVCMLQLSTDGKPFDQIINDAIYFLKKNHPDTFRAFCILCAFHRLGLLVPSSLLASLLSQYPSYLRSLRLDVIHMKADCGARGLIYPGDHLYYEECWQTAHELIAESASNFEFAGDIEASYDEIFMVINPESKEHRIFAGLYFLALTRRSRKKLAKEYLDEYPSLIDSLVSTDSKQQTIWALAFDSLGEKNRVLSCLEIATPTTPRNANTLISLLIKYNQIDKAMESATKWLATHTEDTVVRTRYLSLIERKGTSKQIEDAISKTNKWLTEHSEDTTVRTRYLSLIEQKGTRKQIRDVIFDTNNWLAEHAEDTVVRTRYLSLIEQKGTSKQIEETISETNKWLVAHTEDTVVRTRYLSLIEQKGTRKQIRDVIFDTNNWLAEHAEDTVVRTRYLSLIEQKGTSKQIEEAISETNKWLAEHSEDTYVRTRYLSLIERKGTPKQIESGISDTSNWLSSHPDFIDTSVREGFISLLMQRGDASVVKKALSETRRWLSEQPEDVSIRTRFLGLIEQHGSDDEIIEELESLKVWIIANCDNTAALKIFGVFLRLIQKYHIENPFGVGCLEAIVETSLKAEDVGLLVSLAQYLKKTGEYEFSNKIYLNLIDSKKHGKNYRVFYGYGALLLHLQKYFESIPQFRTALSIYKGHQMAHSGLARALKGAALIRKDQGSYADAERLFEEAETEFKSAIYWSNKQNKPGASFYHHLGWLYIERQLFVNAKSAFEAAIEENPENFIHYWGISKVLVELEDFQSAKDSLELAYAKAPENIEPPASIEMQILLERCQQVLSNE